MATLSISGIYRIRNLLDGKVYIGSSVTVLKRWNKHRSELSRGVHGCRYLQRAWDKYGQVAFVFEFIEEVSSRRKEDLILREQHWLDLTHAYEEAYGYNIKIKADSALGVTRSAETRQKISIAKKGIKLSAEALANLSKALKGRVCPNKGKTFSAEARANMSAAQKKKWSDPALRARQAERYRGRTLSEEHRRNVSIALKGRICSPSTRQKISAAHKGQPKSDAHRQATSAGLRTWWANQRLTTEEMRAPNTGCHGCGKPFFAFLPTRAKWCSQKCRNKANKKHHT